MQLARCSQPGASGPAFGPDGDSSSGPADVSYVTVRLGNGIVLTLHPARVYGVRLVGFAIPVGASVVSATAYSARGEIATAIPFTTDGMPVLVTWLRPGQHGLARSSVHVGSGSYLGGAWSATAYLGPWGICLAGHAGGTDASSCMETTSVTRLGTSVFFWTAGVPAVAYGSAGQSVARVVVTSPGGKTMQVHPVMANGARFFAFPFGRGPKPWKWIAYNGSGHAIASGKVTPESS